MGRWRRRGRWKPVYENITYESLLNGMLQYALTLAAGRGENLDSREGSMLWYGSAPAAVEGQNLYIQLDTVLRETFGDTASRPYLILRARERGLTPDPATPAVGKGTFTPEGVEVPIGSRFRLEDLYYTVTGHTEDGTYYLTCETPGSEANGRTGALVPVEYISGLETAALTETVIPGEDEQSTESFRQEYLESFQAAAFGGNVADYLQKVRSMNGVGGVKVCRAWNGDINPADFTPPEGYDSWYSGLVPEPPEEIQGWLSAVTSAAKNGLLTVGGAVRVVIQDAAWGAPSPELLEQVQTALDPEQNHGEGLGLAPIGHYVTVSGVEEVAVNVALTLAYASGWDWEAAQSYVEGAVETYLTELAQSWQNEDGIVVRLSVLQSRIVVLTGIQDVTAITLNGQEANLTLEAGQVPVKGTVTDGA